MMAMMVWVRMIAPSMKKIVSAVVEEVLGSCMEDFYGKLK